MRSWADQKVVGLVPAAGRAKRIAPLPCSKEIYPIGFRRDSESGELRTQVASHHLFDKFHRAGVTTAYVVLRDGKWDIPAYFRDGRIVGLDLAYVVIEDSLGPADTLDRAHAFIRTEAVAFGFPDILFGPDDVYVRLINQMTDSGSDVTLGLYPATETRPMDMIDVDDAGRIRSMVLKPLSTTLKYTWACAVWRPAFTDFLHTFVESERAKPASSRLSYRDIDAQGDLPVGAVMADAIRAGLQVHGVVFPDDSYVDIGTPDNLVAAVRNSRS